VIIQAQTNNNYETLAIPIRGGVPRTVCRGNVESCNRAGWSPDGKSFYLGGDRRTFAIPVPAGKSLPDFSGGGVIDLKQAVALPPGARTIEAGLISPGSDPSIYVFTKTDSQRNLFRIPLH
jgi:hypothetical protein